MNSICVLNTYINKHRFYEGPLVNVDIMAKYFLCPSQVYNLEAFYRICLVAYILFQGSSRHLVC